MPGSTAVLVINSGSSSVKFAVIDPRTSERPVYGIAERVGNAEAEVTVTTPDGTRTRVPDRTDHQGVLASIIDGARAWTRQHDVTITAVGHRVVHGGKDFTGSILSTPQIIETVRSLIPLAPLHNPACIAGIEAGTALWPEVPQVLVFDTAFHARMPEVAYRYAVPQEWYDELDVRRYGFHGTSHRFVSGAAAELLGRPVEDLRLVTAHLGNGCSVAAVRAGRSVDTSMGMTPLEGLVMGTRSGDVDPGVFDYLATRTGRSLAEINTALNKESGLLGVSGSSNDMRTLRALADDGDERARLAIDLFCYRLAKYIAALCVPLGGLDALVFTGGIGENDARTRQEVCAQLAFLGIRVDPAANTTPADHARAVSAEGTLSVLVVPTDEELVIARDADRIATQTQAQPA